jgi:hypothetical protein
MFRLAPSARQASGSGQGAGVRGRRWPCPVMRPGGCLPIGSFTLFSASSTARRHLSAQPCGDHAILFRNRSHPPPFRVTADWHTAVVALRFRRWSGDG